MKEVSAFAAPKAARPAPRPPAGNPARAFGADELKVRVGTRVDLHRADGRIYALAVMINPQLALFGGAETDFLVLVVVRGRVGKRSIVRSERFDSLERLTRRWRELLGRRRRNGYAMVGSAGPTRDARQSARGSRATATAKRRRADPRHTSMAQAPSTKAIARLIFRF